MPGVDLRQPRLHDVPTVSAPPGERGEAAPGGPRGSSTSFDRALDGAAQHPSRNIRYPRRFARAETFGPRGAAVETPDRTPSDPSGRLPTTAEMKPPTLILIALAALGAAPCADAIPAHETALPAFRTALDAPAAFGWRAREADHLCGIRIPEQISNPATVDFRRAMSATEELRRMEREGIDPNSARGQALTAAAKRRVREAAAEVKDELGHCSVWKEISHVDGREVADITAEILRLL